MEHPSRRWRAVFSAVVAVAAVSLAACTPGATSTATPRTPKLKPPAIASAGVLRVTVDASYPPFAARQGARFVGIDADVAAALADELGLKLELVDARPGAFGKTLREHRADVALGGVAITQAALSDFTIAGSYLTDGPGLFATDGTLTPDALQGVRVAVQKGSPAYWAMSAQPGTKLVVVPSLRQAFTALSAGKADAVAGDTIVGAYIRRDFAGVRFMGQLGDATPLGVAVPTGAQSLEAAVRDALDALTGTGVLDAIRSKWEGDLPALSVGGSTETSSAETTRGIDTSVAPSP